MISSFFKENVKPIVATTVVLALLLAGLFYMWGPQIIHHVWSMIRGSFIFWTILWAGVLGAGAVLFASWRRDYKTKVEEWGQKFAERKSKHTYEWGYSSTLRKPSLGDSSVSVFAIVTASAIGLVAIVGAFVSISFVGHLKMKEYLPSIQTKGVSESPEYRLRAPFGIADRVISSTLDDSTGEKTGSAKSLPQIGDHGEWQVSVKRRGIGVGYESTTVLDVPVFGSASASKATHCDFSTNANLRLGGALHDNSMERAVYSKTSPSVIIERDDAFTV